MQQQCVELTLLGESEESGFIFYSPFTLFRDACIYTTIDRVST